MRAKALVLALLAATANAFAARPLVTDDAPLLDKDACQVESWVQRNRHSTQTWLLPACNPWGNAELSLGGATTHEDGRTRTTDVQLQAKLSLKAFGDDSWGAGLVIGTVHKPQREAERGLGDTYFYIPVSLAIPETSVLLHANAGAARLQDEKRTAFTWGVAAEFGLTERATIVAEAFGLSHARPYHQFGLRYEVVKDRMQVDATYGNRGSGNTDDRFFSAGVRFQW